MKLLSYVLIGLIAVCMLISTVSAESTAEYNLRVGKEFLAQKSLEADVVTLPSGLRYKVLTKSGSTVSPTRADKVKAHYRGTLITGKEFDSSYKRGQPLVFPLSGVIAGWTEGLQLMAKGDKYELYIPSELGYGARGAGRDIGPNAALVFQVELVDIISSKQEL